MFAGVCDIDDAVYNRYHKIYKLSNRDVYMIFSLDIRSKRRSISRSSCSRAIHKTAVDAYE